MLLQAVNFTGYRRIRRTLALVSFFCICRLSILAVILIKHNENANINGRKREANMIEHNRQE